MSLKVNCREINHVTLKRQMGFLNKTCKSTTEKRNCTIEFCVLQVVSVTTFQLKITILIFSTYTQRGYSGRKQKSAHHHCIMHIRISLGPKFQLELTVFSLRTKFGQERISSSKTEKLNTTIEFFIFELF